MGGSWGTCVERVLLSSIKAQEKRRPLKGFKEEEAVELSLKSRCSSGQKEGKASQGKKQTNKRKTRAARAWGWGGGGWHKEAAEPLV